VFLFVLFVVLLGYIFDMIIGYYINIRVFPVFTVLAFIIATVQSFVGYFSGHKLVLSSLKARLANPAQLKEFTAINVVRELSIAAGLPSPKVYIIPDTDPNAMATGKDPKHSYIGITEGLLNMMTREELQGVVAHELSHIKNYDILLATTVSALMGAVLLLSDWMKRSLFIGIDKKSGRRGGRRIKFGGAAGPILIVLAIIFLILAPIVARLLALAVSRAREYFADARAVQLTRNPLGLANALRKIANSQGPIDSATYGTAHLFIADPLRRKLSDKEGCLAELFSTHPPIEKRIAILERMAHIRK
ncbi:MAG: M48 family metallopeptidase, partial [bacterium]